MGAVWRRGSILASHPAAPGSFLAVPRIVFLMLRKVIDGTTYNSGQRSDDVNRTHLVLASGWQAITTKNKSWPRF